jgi:hypothetical protein
METVVPNIQFDIYLHIFAIKSPKIMFMWYVWIDRIRKLPIQSLLLSSGLYYIQQNLWTQLTIFIQFCTKIYI